MTITCERKEEMRQRVQDAVAHSFEEYDFLSILTDALAESFTISEMKWAIENIDWTVVILEKPYSSEEAVREAARATFTPDAVKKLSGLWAKD